MNRISIYILLVLIFLGLSKSFSPSEQRVPYVENEYVYSNFFQGAPLSIILVDYFKAGFIIKTYFHRYKIVHGFKNPEYITVRVSKKFWKKNTPHLGLSLFRRRELDNQESSLPLPPGALFLGDPSFGFWEEQADGKKRWSFHRAYKHFPSYFGWDNFTPDMEFYRNLTVSIGQEKVFFGNNNEFGTEGTITKKIYAQSKVFRPRERLQLKQQIKRFLAPPWMKESEKL